MDHSLPAIVAEEWAAHLTNQAITKGPSSGSKRVSVCQTGGSVKRRRLQPSYMVTARAEAQGPFSILANEFNILGALSSMVMFMKEADQLPAMADMISDIMSRNRWNIQLLISGVRALGVSGPFSLSGLNYGDCIITAMKEHPFELTLQVEGCRALSRWIRSDSGMLELGQPTWFSAIFKAACRHSESSMLRCMGQENLRILACTASKQKLAVATDPECMTAIMTFLRQNISNIHIQQVGLSLLSGIVEEEKCREVVVEQKGLEHVLRSMQTHVSDQMVQCNGSATLCWLIHTGDPNTSDLFAGEAFSGTRTILNNLARFIGDACVFGNSACILCGIFFLASSPEDLARAGTIPLLFQGIKTHESVKVHRNCLTLFRLLTTHENVDVRRLLVENLPIIMGIMDKYKEDAGIQIEACGILANLCFNPTFHEKLLSSGCVEKVTQSQLHNVKNLRMQQVALCFHRLLLHGTTTATEEATNAFGGGPEVLEYMLTGTDVMDGIEDQQQQR